MGPSQNGLRDGMVRSTARLVKGWSALSLDQGFLAGIILVKSESPVFNIGLGHSERVVVVSFHS